MDWKFRRSDFRRPAVQLEHVDMELRFFEDRVEAKGVLTMRAKAPVDRVELDCDGVKVQYALDREYVPDECFTLAVEHVSHPDDVRLEGIYRDTTPAVPGSAQLPQQYMSQCQQYGFQRILPIIDDCTAKCTFRTTLVGDARYTHLISNGNVVEDVLLPPPGDGSPRQRRVVYENPKPMAPYLFIACAGTWDVLKDEVVYPDGAGVVKLEYLVPPGHVDGARVPMEILKKSILFQHELTGFVYPYDTYRTICMERSLYGGMENTGNTTIITEAALVDDTITDRRLVYAHGVIPHEYEHSHCGSGVTMESVFDMWLNEAYTVNVERAFLAREFGAAFTRRLEIDALRETGGAFAEEESRAAGAVVREGVNDPDEVVDAITYDKAPEVLNTLRNLVGTEAYDSAWREYFRRFDGGNANTDDFLRVFSEVTGRDVAALMRPWLFETGCPTVSAGWEWRDGTLTVKLKRDRPFTVPVPFALVKDGRDVSSGVFTLDQAGVEYSVRCPRPDYISWNRGCGFYGMLANESSSSELALQARTDPDFFNRGEAMRILRDRGETEDWLAIWCDVFRDSAIDVGAKASMLAIPADSLDRRRRALVRENVREMHALRAEVARRIGVGELVCALAGESPHALDAKGMARRAYENVILQLLAEEDSGMARDAIRGYLGRARNITARLNALRALVACGDSKRYDVLARHGRELRESLNGYIGYLGVVASDRHEDVFDAIAAEERRKGWSIRHPALSRALYCGFAANGDRLWTDRGLAWLERKLVVWAGTSEYNALRLLAPLANWRMFEPGLRAEAKALLERMSVELPREKFAFVGGRLAAMLEG